MPTSILILDSSGTFGTPIVVICTVAGKGAPIEIGERTRSFNKTHISSIRGEKKTWQVHTMRVSTAREAEIQALIANARHINCSGELLANVQTLCVVRCPKSDMMPSTVEWEMQLIIEQV